MLVDYLEKLFSFFALVDHFSILIFFEISFFSLVDHINFLNIMKYVFLFRKKL